MILVKLIKSSASRSNCSIAFGANCDSFARMHSGTCLAGRGAISSFLELVQKFCGGIDGEIATDEVFAVASNNPIKFTEGRTGELYAIFKVF
jgi:hypothetical protein